MLRSDKNRYRTKQRYDSRTRTNASWYSIQEDEKNFGPYIRNKKFVVFLFYFINRKHKCVDILWRSRSCNRVSR